MKKKILFISQSCIPERIGGATHNFDMAKKLSKLDYEIDFLTSQPSYPFGEFINVKKPKVRKVNKNLKIIRLKSYRPKVHNPDFFSRILYISIFSINAAFFVLTKHINKKYDLIITSIPNEPCLLPGIISKKIFGKKWIIDIRDLWFENSIELGLLNKESIISKIFREFRKYCFKNADGMTYTARTIIDKLKDSYEIPSLICFNPNGIEPELVPKNKNKRKNVIYHGNVGLAYELDLIIEAIKLSNYNNWKLIIRGSGDSLEDIIEKVKKDHLQDRVTFLPPMSRNEMMDLISECKIGVCPLKKKTSLSSALPVKVIEYIGCGTPFICSGIGEVKKIANDSNAGFHVKSEPAEYAKAIDKIMQNEELFCNMSKNAKKFAYKYFDKNKIIFNVDKFLSEI